MRILVAGAGIGGLTAALALARRGFDIHLIEKAAAFAPIGAGLQLSPNASRVLFDLGLEAPLRAAATRPERIVIRSETGGMLAAIPLGDAAEARYGAPYLVVHRAALHAILLDAVRPHAPIEMNAAATGASGADAPTGLGIQRGDAVEHVQADLVVAANGLHSALRGAVLRDGPSRFSGKRAWRTILPPTSIPPDLSRIETGLWLSSRRHVVHYPLGDGGLNVVAITDGPDMRGWASHGDPEDLMHRFADAPPLLRDLLSAAPDWQCWSLADRVPARPWFGNGLVLLGDAAHPALPFAAQGAAMAIEDAAVLAAELAASPASVGRALARYEARRAPRTAFIQRLARRQGRIFHMSPPLAYLRDLVLRRMSPTALLARQDRIYGWRT